MDSRKHESHEQKIWVRPTLVTVETRDSYSKDSVSCSICFSMLYIPSVSTCSPHNMFAVARDFDSELCSQNT